MYFVKLPHYRQRHKHKKVFEVVVCKGSRRLPTVVGIDNHLFQHAVKPLTVGVTANIECAAILTQCNERPW